MMTTHATHTAPAKPSDRDLLLRLLRVSQALERRLDGQLSMTRGISYREYRLLSEMSEAPADAIMRVDLARRVGLTPSAVTRALRPLEKLGYVRTESDPRDARRSLAALTKGGRKLLSDSEAAVAATFDGLQLESEDHAALEGALDRIEQTSMRSR